jgi:Asp-tRNA(Asn)/Glu-tRNA(Gln) amidotransferase A subunit family amidase
MSSFDDLAGMSAPAIAGSVRARKISAVEVAKACLARIDAAQPTLNCFITVSAETALADATAIDAKVARGEDAGPLAGVPLHVKDLVNTKGVRTTFGSHIFADNVPPHQLYERFTAASGPLENRSELCGDGIRCAPETTGLATDLPRRRRPR